jgi:hypothetical protein
LFACTHTQKHTHTLTHTIHYNTQIWETLKPYYLNLLRSGKEGPGGGMHSYLWPPESNLTMIHNYRSALASGHVTSDSNPLLFHLAIYHLSHYIFSARIGCAAGHDERDRRTGLREGGRHVLRTLVQEAEPPVYLAVCAYLAPSLEGGVAAGAGQGGGRRIDEWRAAVEELVKRMKGEMLPEKLCMPFWRGEQGGVGGKHHVGGVLEGSGCGGGSGGRDHEQARKERWELLVAECARDDVMFAKVRRDGGVLGEEAFLKMQRDRVC